MKSLHQTLIAGLIVAGLPLAAAGQESEAQRPSITELQEMTPSERRDAIGNWREFLQNLTDEERSELRAAMQEGAAKRMAYIDSLTEQEREAMMTQRQERRAAIAEEAEKVWNTLSEAEKDEYRQQVAERMEERRGRHGEGGFGFGRRGQQ